MTATGLSDLEAIVIAMTVDQRGSRRGPDLVQTLLRDLGSTPSVRRFERTAGDEVQGLLDDAGAAVDLALALARQGTWSIGIGVGDVRTPLPRSVRAAAGPALEHARSAVQRAKSSGPHLAVDGQGAARAGEAEAVLRMLAVLVQRRTDAGWEVTDLLATGLTQRDAAARLGVSAQAVNQRARAAWWQHEQELRPLAARLVSEAGLVSEAAG